MDSFLMESAENTMVFKWLVCQKIFFSLDDAAHTYYVLREVMGGQTNVCAFYNEDCPHSLILSEKTYINCIKK